MNALDQLRVNLENAAHSGETLRIGGGLFSPAEISRAVTEIKRLQHFDTQRAQQDVIAKRHFDIND
jgi:hypothetical protein